MTTQRWHAYLRSLSEELKSQANRVRDLIGDVHWYSDGHHKEVLLLQLLKRFLPHGMRAARGFVLRPGQAAHVTSEQDILILDSHAGSPLFDQSDMVIAFPDTVRASISVKTQLTKEQLIDALAGSLSLRNASLNTPGAERIWCGVFAYERHQAMTTSQKHIKQWLSEVTRLKPFAKLPGAYPVGPNTICIADAGLLCIDYDDGDAVRIHDEPEIATAIFLQQLLSHLAQSRGHGRSSLDSFVELAAD